MSKNAERLKKYRAKMDDAGFRRLSFYVCPELGQLLDREHRPSECRGRTLERLLLGKAAKRPDYWTEEERARRTAKCQAIMKKFKLS
ncbi:hypothetical protein SAMN05216317_1621 [Nitrosomonas eutropha]|nr:MULTISPECIES: hypothetical protein [Nitrosomonas]MXS81444.1 hypothetical protein [Nitrosomonas sp. GH22]SDX19208.1 hypothetical protein SAMN05216317_1621 [Nitrosomonas eutropha]